MNNKPFEPGDPVTVRYTGYWIRGEIVEPDDGRGWVMVREKWNSNGGEWNADEHDGNYPEYLAAAEFVRHEGEPLASSSFWGAILAR